MMLSSLVEPIRFPLTLFRADQYRVEIVSGAVSIEPDRIG